MNLLGCITNGHIIHVLSRTSTQGKEYYDITLNRKIEISTISKEFAFELFRKMVEDATRGKEETSIL